MNTPSLVGWLIVAFMVYYCVVTIRNNLKGKKVKEAIKEVVDRNHDKEEIKEGEIVNESFNKVK